MKQHEADSLDKNHPKVSNNEPENINCYTANFAHILNEIIHQYRTTNRNKVEAIKSIEYNFNAEITLQTAPSHHSNTGQRSPTSP